MTTTTSFPALERPRLPELSEVTGVILCGGASRRMGRDKALIELDGRRLIDTAVEALAEVAGRTVLASGSEARYAELGLDRVLDTGPGAGPLRGLLAGLEAAETPWIVALASDMPRVDGGLLRALLETASAGGLEACLARSAKGAEPLCAVYHRRCAAAVRRALERGERKLVSFHGDVAVGYLDLGERADRARSLNTPAQLEAERAARRPGGDA